MPVRSNPGRSTARIGTWTWTRAIAMSTRPHRASTIGCRGSGTTRLFRRGSTRRTPTGRAAAVDRRMPTPSEMPPNCKDSRPFRGGSGRPLTPCLFSHDASGPGKVRARGTFRESLAPALFLHGRAPPDPTNPRLPRAMEGRDKRGDAHTQGVGRGISMGCARGEGLQRTNLRRSRRSHGSEKSRWSARAREARGVYGSPAPPLALARPGRRRCVPVPSFLQPSLASLDDECGDARAGRPHPRS
jgi:hypothetical protein